MKKLLIASAFLFVIISVGAQEKRIPFNKGTLKVCSSSFSKISGYNGNEIVIKAVKSLDTLYAASMFNNSIRAYLVSKSGKVRLQEARELKEMSEEDREKILSESSKEREMANEFSNQRQAFYFNSENRTNGLGSFFNGSSELEEGLESLSKKSIKDSLFLDIKKSNGEIIISDIKSKYLHVGSYAYYNYKQYELLVPNSVKLVWNGKNCQSLNSFSYTRPLSLSDFKGEVEISSSYSPIELTNVTGPVLANTLGGNITVVFNNTNPEHLYSLISNGGYIDVAIPEKAHVSIDASGSDILSNINFKIEKHDRTLNNFEHMKLLLNKGNTKMKLDAKRGKIYLRKSK